MIYFWITIVAYTVSVIGLGILMLVATDIKQIKNHIDTIYSEIVVIKESQLEIIQK
tara:strand:- start:1903 stop:2070 length:168 start_codon:yes stop_codon:yes gene_type:complete